jgi:predicted membrane channel-forming protein YqfA (hemolysin III family)
MLAKTVKDTAELPKREFAERILLRPLTIVCLGLMLLLIFTAPAPYWITALVWTGGWALALIYFARNGWLPGTPDAADFKEGKFCEAEESGWIKQPMNSHSNMGFIVVGLFIVLLAGLRSESASNPMAEPGSFVPLLYGLTVIFLGPGSMFFHASGKMWAGWFDTMSMVIWAAFGLSYTASQLLTHWYGWSQQVLLVIMLVLIIGGIGVKTLRRELPNFRADLPPREPVEEPHSGLDEIMWVVIGWLIFEAIFVVLMLFGNPTPFRRNASWLIAALLAFGAAFVCWVPSNGRIPIVGIKSQWCNPDSWYQGHAFWHLFSALGALMIYLYYASEV